MSGMSLKSVIDNAASSSQATKGEEDVRGKRKGRVRKGKMAEWMKRGGREEKAAQGKKTVRQRGRKR